MMMMVDCERTNSFGDWDEERKLLLRPSDCWESVQNEWNAVTRGFVFSFVGHTTAPEPPVRAGEMKEFRWVS